MFDNIFSLYNNSLFLKLYKYSELNPHNWIVNTFLQNVRFDELCKFLILLQNFFSNSLEFSNYAILENSAVLISLHPLTPPPSYTPKFIEYQPPLPFIYYRVSQ